MNFWHTLLTALRDLSSHKFRAALATVGIVFGVASVEAMISISEGARRQTLERIAILGVDNVIARSIKPRKELPRGGDLAKVLSGGEQQRISIARAIVGEPALILADEPTGNLDEKTGNEILALFDQLIAGGQTMILVTHNPAYKDRVQTTLRMHDGELVS